MKFSASDRFDITADGCRSGIPSSRLKYSFETSADGRIRLSPDWSQILSSIGLLPRFYSQVEHAYGRIATKMTRKELFHSIMGQPDQTTISTPENFCGWWSADARIQTCQCCGSPGQINIRNSQETSFLQFNPAADVSATDWARVIYATVRPKWSKTSKREEPDASENTIPLPDSAVDLGVRGSDCVELIERISQREKAVRVTIHTPEVALSKTVALNMVSNEAGLLRCRGKDTIIYISCGAIHETAAHFCEGHIELLMVGPQGEVLFSIRSGPSAEDEANFIAAIGL
ncbi:MAG: hypothetical protein AAF065_03745 [Verrucomicrobiota bacterium]